MNMRNNRRGFTLTELTVVLAVLTIVLTMVVSFTAMINNSRQISSARLEALQDIQVAETVIERFIEGNEITTKFENNAEGNPIPVNTLKASDNKTIGLEENEGRNVLVIKKGEDVDTTITLDRVKSITFDYYGDNTEGIFYCTIEYKVGNQDYDYTFCVYSYTGATIQEEGTNEQG